ncbi:MAG: hypothetical protein LBC80_04160 [Treponema sp.]|jgi:pectate lyase|nr:hypothetical protein [Treponema sp.]
MTKQTAKLIFGVILILSFSLVFNGCSDSQPPPSATIDIIQENIQLFVGNTSTLLVEVTSSSARVIWSSLYDNLVSVDENGVVTALQLTTQPVTIMAHLEGNEEVFDTCLVSVIQPGGGGNNGGDDGGGNDTPVGPPDGGEIISGAVTITDSGGWLETLYVKWDKLPAANSYNVYYQAANDSTWIKIDDPLIREYPAYFRADVLGISAGRYNVKVLPVNAGGTETGEPALVNNIEVVPHVRSGFAFVNGVVPGGYKMDGTPKEGARILYLTDSNKHLVTLDVRDNAAGREATFTGLNAIMRAYEAGHDVRPLIVRFIGRINDTHRQVGSSSSTRPQTFTDNQGSVSIVGPSDTGRAAFSGGFNITFEGVGNDAVAYGWGFRTSRAFSIEIRNFGFKMTNTQGADAIELNTSGSVVTRHIWVHNNDFFYGVNKGGDQSKGDGMLDIKSSNNVTVSFNIFWDSGKSSLLGNSASEPVGHITYHHNWFNYSDSRHPRVRVHKVHVYNNYFAGIGKYGVGATTGSSIFVDRNYFRNSRRPMMISRQGSDIASGSGTFSGDPGGMIKAYGNYMDAFSASQYRAWSASNQIEFDAYEVSSPNAPVPNTVTAKQGGAVYDNNFLAYSYTADDPETARQNVITLAGRYWGGDLRFTFNDADRELTDNPVPAITNAIQNHPSTLVSVQGLP